MKNLLVLSSVLLGGSLLASGFHHNTTTTTRSYKRFTWDNTGPVGAVSIVIDKSDYELSVYDDKGWYATYPVVFGNSSLEDKQMEGDRKTPEGSFHVTSKKLHTKW